MRDDAIAGIDSLARARLGLVTADQLLELGFSPRQVENRVASGALIVVRRGVYRLPGVVPSWEQCLLAAILTGPNDGVASHRSAARIWRLRGIDGDVLEVTSARRRRLEGVIPHQCQLPAVDVTLRGAIPVTTQARTLCDLSGMVPDAILGRAFDEALRTDQTTLTAVDQCLARLHQVRGRRELAPIRDLVADRREGAGLGDSELETKIIRWIGEADLPAPVTQYRVRLQRRTYRFDAAYPDLRIAIEFHGWYEHGKRSAFEPDLTRRNHIELAGWLLLEFADKHTKADVIRTLAAARARQALELRRLA